MPINQIKTKAVSSSVTYNEDETHRLWLQRHYTSDEPLRILHWLLCNPSVATAEFNDVTLAKLERLTLRWGFNSFIATNAFTFRSRHFHFLKEQAQPNDPRNNNLILQAVQQAEMTICGWSDHVFYLNRHTELCTLLKAHTLHALYVTKRGAPAHPIYLPEKSEPKIFQH